MKSIQQHTNPFAAALYQMIQVERRCSQTQLADNIGYTQSSISALMLEKTEGIEKKRRKIADFFGMSYEDFLSFGEKIIERQRLEKEAANMSEHANISEIADKARLRYQIVIEGFEDKERALRLNEKLIQLEKRDPDKLKSLEDMLNGWLVIAPPEPLKKTGTTDKQES